MWISSRHILLEEHLPPKAVNMGVSINDIISIADWTNIRTFEKFYHRPLESEDYLPAVLQEEANC